ncbi:MAG: phosphonopyruvate decarboxylase [bacterium]|nr:phosphonopyruvate decarboxylase [bacterium]
MLKSRDFFNLLKASDIIFFTGVPDSLLKHFCAYIADHTGKSNHIITANEGGAIALAAGHYLATSKSALVYMQNSGQGNSINPLVSLADPKVYGLPMLLLIGWRGQPIRQARGKPVSIDEPQHEKQGSITLDLLKTLGIKYAALPKDARLAKLALAKAVKYMKKQKAPYAFVVSKDTFEPHKVAGSHQRQTKLSREDAVKMVIDQSDSKDTIVSTTGMISRELFEYRESLKQKHDSDFLTVGSMGHVSQIALGIALAKPKRSVYCLDGDGSVIMHMGSLAIIGQAKPGNLRHIVFNNGVHDSVGGQPTAAANISLAKIAKDCGYRIALTADSVASVRASLAKLKTSHGPAMLEINVSKGHRDNLGRPKMTPEQLKKKFMKYLTNA